MKLHDIIITPAQLRKAAEWVDDSADGADIELLVDDRMLVVGQGDDKTAFDTGGEPGSDEYIALAPLDRSHPKERDMNEQEHERTRAREPRAVGRDFKRATEKLSAAWSCNPGDAIDNYPHWPVDPGANVVSLPDFEEFTCMVAEMRVKPVEPAPLVIPKHDEPTVGQRVILKRAFERFPFAQVDAEEKGTVRAVSDEYIEVQMDTHFDGLREWDNAIIFSPEDGIGYIDGADLGRLPDEISPAECAAIAFNDAFTVIS